MKFGVCDFDIVTGEVLLDCGMVGAWRYGIWVVLNSEYQLWEYWRNVALSPSYTEVSNCFGIFVYFQNGCGFMLDCATLIWKIEDVLKGSAKADLDLTHSIKLGLTPKYSTFYYDILNSSERVLKVREWLGKQLGKGFEIKGRSKSAGGDVKIAGCRVIDGHVTRASTLRLLRSGKVLFEGSCSSLKKEKHDVDVVGKGNECGLVLRDWHDFQIGDMIQCLEQVIRKPKFISSESGAVRIQC